MVLVWGLVVQRLVRPFVVVGVDPCPQLEPRVLDGREAVAPAELFLERLGEALAQAVLLRRVGRDVFLLESVVLDHCTVLARTEDQAVVVTQQHAGRRTAESAETAEEGFLEGAFGGLGSPGALKGVAEHFPGTTVDDRDEDTPAILATVDERQIGGPALVGL